LETRTGRPSSILLRFTPTWVGNKKITIICHKLLPEFILTLLIYIFGMVGNDALGNGGTNSVDLSGLSSSLYSNTDINVGVFVLSEDENWFIDFVTKSLWFDILNGLTIDFDETTSLLGKRTCSGGLFSIL